MTAAALWIFSAVLDMGLGLGAIASAAAALGIFGLAGYAPVWQVRAMMAVTG